MSELTTLPNIAAKLDAQLMDVGITTIDQLKEAGAGRRGSAFCLVTHRPAITGFAV